MHSKEEFHQFTKDLALTTLNLHHSFQALCQTIPTNSPDWLTLAKEACDLYIEGSTQLTTALDICYAPETHLPRPNSTQSLAEASNVIARIKTRIDSNSTPPRPNAIVHPSNPNFRFVNQLTPPQLIQRTSQVLHDAGNNTTALNTYCNLGNNCSPKNLADAQASLHFLATFNFAEAILRQVPEFKTLIPHQLQQLIRNSLTSSIRPPRPTLEIRGFEESKTLMLPEYEFYRLFTNIGQNHYRARKKLTFIPPLRILGDFRSSSNRIITCEPNGGFHPEITPQLGKWYQFNGRSFHADGHGQDMFAISQDLIKIGFQLHIATFANQEYRFACQRLTWKSTNSPEITSV